MNFKAVTVQFEWFLFSELRSKGFPPVFQENLFLATLRPPERPATATTPSMGYVRLPGTRFGQAGGGFVVHRVPRADVGTGKYVAR